MLDDAGALLDRPRLRGESVDHFLSLAPSIVYGPIYQIDRIYVNSLNWVCAWDGKEPHGRKSDLWPKECRTLVSPAYPLPIHKVVLKP